MDLSLSFSLTHCLSSRWKHMSKYFLAIILVIDRCVRANKTWIVTDIRISWCFCMTTVVYYWVSLEYNYVLEICRQNTPHTHTHMHTLCSVLGWDMNRCTLEIGIKYSNKDTYNGFFRTKQGKPSSVPLQIMKHDRT